MTTERLNVSKASHGCVRLSERYEGGDRMVTGVAGEAKMNGKN